MLKRISAPLLALALLAGVFTAVAPPEPAQADNVRGCIDSHWTYPRNTAKYSFYNSNQSYGTTCYWTFTTYCRRANGSVYALYDTQTIRPYHYSTAFRSVWCGRYAHAYYREVRTYTW